MKFRKLGLSEVLPGFILVTMLAFTVGHFSGYRRGQIDSVTGHQHWHLTKELNRWQWSN